MVEIVNRNCCGVCMESHCNDISTEAIEIRVYGLILLIELCKRHAQNFFATKEKHMEAANDRRNH